MYEVACCATHIAGEALVGEGVCGKPPTVLTSSTNATQIHHPFAVNLRFAFQDDENCFFVLDFMSGGSLRRKLSPVACDPLLD